MIHERTIREVLNKLLAGLDPFEEKQVSREQWHEAGGFDKARWRDYNIITRQPAGDCNSPAPAR